MRKCLLGLTAAAVLAVPVMAHAREFVYRGQFKGEPQSSVMFDAIGNKKGTKIRKVEHVSLWEWPGQACGTNTFLSFFGPFDIASKEFSIDIGDTDIRGKLKQQGKKVAGTLVQTGNCATSGRLTWSARRMK